jgi:toxin HigB-1
MPCFGIAWMPCDHAFMIESFFDQASEDLFNGVYSTAARRCCPETLWNIVTRKLDPLDSVQSLEELKIPPGNRLEALVGNRKGQYSIRINAQYRICFVWGDAGPSDVAVTDDHEGY